METVWTSQGYKIPYNKEVAKELTLKSELPPKKYIPQKSILCYKVAQDNMYIPYWFGESRFGKPQKKFVQNIHTFEHEFRGSLREYQIETVDKTLNHFENQHKGGVWSIGTGMGKCFAKDTEILMLDGTVKKVQDVRIGDFVMGWEYGMRIVSGTNSGYETMYRIIPQDGSKGYTVNESHILTLFDNLTGVVVDVPLIDYMEYINYNELMYSDEYCGIRHIPVDISNWEYKVEKYRFRIEKLGIGQYFGFCIRYSDRDEELGFVKQGSRRFLLGDYTVVHNTVMALSLVQRLGVRTLIIVHKKILLNQWIERINQFIPNASVGIIQGQLADIENDIVIGMVQTMTNRVYTKEAFKTIGLLICDEVHVICCNKFSNILFSVQTKYRLGLSATPKRRDGFDKVIYYHLGPVIVDLHQTIVTPEINIYEAPDIGLELETTPSGIPKIGKLINEMCDNDVRNSFITRLVLYYVRQNRKIIVFSDRVAHCEILDMFFKANYKLEDKISDSFTGKKKKEQLDEAMKADVIFATYAIFREGIDCPELDTLIFATPKSDVIQAVGRILRQYNNKTPIVIDVVDNIQILKYQYYKRKKYYRSKDYVIKMMDIFYNKQTKLFETNTKEIIQTQKSLEQKDTPHQKCMIKNERE